MSQTTVRADLFEAFQIFTELVVERVRSDLRIFAVLDVFLSIQKPVGYFVLTRIGDDGHDTVNFFFGQFTGALVRVNVGFAQAYESISATDTLDGSKRERYFYSTVNVCIQYTKNVLKLFWHD